MSTRHVRDAAIIVLLLGAMACSKAERTSPFPRDVQFDLQTLTRAAAWTRGGTSGAAYVAPGGQLASAPLQVGVIVSTQFATAAALHEWIRQESYRSGTVLEFIPGPSDDSCKIGVEGTRAYMALAVCKTGVARAACVESDRTLDGDVITSCAGRSGCFDIYCDRRFAAEREPLDLLAAEILSAR